MIFLAFIVFILGLVIGSFLNCVIYRLEQEETMQGRSYCPHCKHPLVWTDLIPVLSFLFLGAKCRYCHQGISWQYPAVEILTGLVFLVVYLFHPDVFTVFDIVYLCFLLYASSSLVIIFIYDLKHFLIPDVVLFPAIAVTVIYQLIFQTHFFLFNSLWAGLLAFLFFWIIFFVSKEQWMGFGDCKLAIFLGLILGFPNILVGLFLSFFFGAIIGLGLMVQGRTKLKSQIPFAPFLIAGTFVAMIWGTNIIHWYLSQFVI